MLLSVIHPSRGRTEQAYVTAAEWHNKADGAFEYILSIDDSDSEKSEYIDLFGNHSVLIGDNKSAIEAINAAAKIATGDLMVVISDDFDCHEHWDTLLKSEVAGQSDFVLKTRDGLQPLLVTLPIVDRVWYDRYGYIYHHEYKHMGCDVELTAVAIMQGKLIRSQLEFRHLHYSTGATSKDAVNENNDTTYAHGEEVLARHKTNNFGIESPVCTYESIDWETWPVKLSILIATTARRSDMLAPLLNSLMAQIGASHEVEVLVDSDELDCIGKKRNSLLEASNGEYVVFIDDDDKIPNFYVAEIICAVQSNPDCVGINGTISTNGWNFRKWYISRDYADWSEGEDGTYYRTPNHISPVRRELAISVKFPEIAHGEDLDFSRRLLPLLKTEVKIEEPIYYYDFRTSRV